MSDVEIRDEVLKFAEAIELKLREHDRIKRDTWKTIPVPFLEDKLKEEYFEYVESLAIDKSLQEIDDELIDMSCVCAMLDWRYRELDNPKTKH